MPDQNCPNPKCPHKPKIPRQTIALLLTLVLIAASWILVVTVEKRAPTIFEVTFAISSVIGLLLEPIELKNLLTNFLDHHPGED